MLNRPLTFFFTKVMRVGAAAQAETSSLGHLNSNKLSPSLVPNEERIYSTKSPQERSARTQAEGRRGIRARHSQQAAPALVCCLEGTVTGDGGGMLSSRRRGHSEN